MLLDPACSWTLDALPFLGYVLLLGHGQGRKDTQDPARTCASTSQGFVDIKKTGTYLHRDDSTPDVAHVVLPNVRGTFFRRLATTGETDQPCVPTTTTWLQYAWLKQSLWHRM